MVSQIEKNDTINEVQYQKSFDKKKNLYDLQSECLSHMASNEIPFAGPIIADGIIQRFSIDHKKKKTDEWYVAYEGVSFRGNAWLNCVYGSWSTGEKYYFNSWDKNNYLDEQELQELRQKAIEAREKAEQAIKEEHEKAAVECQKKWELCENIIPTSSHSSYLDIKKVKAYGIRYGNNPDGYASIILPIYNNEEQIRSLQYISVGQDQKTFKKFHLGGQKKGNYFVLGNIVNGQPVYICEGYATGASCHEALEKPVVVAFDSGNISRVIDNLLKKYPDSKITILADDDRESKNIQGEFINPGKQAAEEAAKLYGCNYILPNFPDGFRLPNEDCPTDFNDVHVLFGLDALKQQLKNASHANWEEPTPLPDGIPPVASFEPEILPDSLRGWIMDIAERMQIPPDFSAAAAIVVLGSLIGRKLGIHPKEKDDWVVVPNLWGAIVGRPSLMKSPAISEVMKPLNQFAVAAKTKYDKEIEEHEFKKMKLKAQKSVLEDSLKKAAKKKCGNEELDALIASRPKIESSDTPVEKRYKTEDGTTEKIGEILLENPRGILIHRDELTGWFKSLDKDNREGDRAFFLESWNGTGSFTVDRIGRGTLHIPALCLSILGGIQPGPLSSYVYQATKGGVGDDGLLQRFQLTVWPDAPKEWVNIDRWPDTEAKKRAYEIFKRIDSYEHPSNLIVSDLDVPAIRFSSEGQQIFNLWRAELEIRIRSGDLSPSMEAHLAKYRSLMPSLALIFQFCLDTDQKREIKQVDRPSAELAVQWCKYLETHAYRLYASAENPAIESARALLQRIKKGNLTDGFTLRDIYRSEWSKLSNLEEAKNATDILVEYGWIRCEEKRTSTKPAKIFRLHPKLRNEKIL